MHNSEWDKHLRDMLGDFRPGDDQPHWEEFARHLDARDTPSDASDPIQDDDLHDALVRYQPEGEVSGWDRIEASLDAADKTFDDNVRKKIQHYEPHFDPLAWPAFLKKFTDHKLLRAKLIMLKVVEFAAILLLVFTAVHMGRLGKLPFETPLFDTPSDPSESATLPGDRADAGIESAVGSEQLAVHSSQSAVGSSQSAVGSSQSAVGSEQLAVHSSDVTSKSPFFDRRSQGAKVVGRRAERAYKDVQKAVEAGFRGDPKVGSEQLAVYSSDVTLKSPLFDRRSQGAKEVGRRAERAYKDVQKAVEAGFRGDSAVGSEQLAVHNSDVNSKSPLGGFRGNPKVGSKQLAVHSSDLTSKSPFFDRQSQQAKEVGRRAERAYKDVQKAVEAGFRDNPEVSSSELAVGSQKSEVSNADATHHMGITDYLAAVSPNLTFQSGVVVPAVEFVKLKPGTFVEFSILTQTDYNMLRMPEDRLYSAGKQIVFPSQGIPSQGYGAGFTIAIGHPIWALESGIIYSGKTFRPGRQLIVGGAFDNGSVEFEAMRLQMVSVPVQYRYRFERQGRLKAYALAGLAAHVIAQSDIDVVIKYHFPSLAAGANPNHDPYFAQTIRETRRISEHIRDGAPFSTKSFFSANAGLGLEYSLTPHKTLFLQSTAQYQIPNLKFSNNNGKHIRTISLQAGVRTPLGE